MPANILPPLCPMLAVHDARAAMTWYQKYLGAQDLMRLIDGEGQVVHGELQIGAAIFMLAQENPAFNSSPQTAKATTVILNLQVDDPDAVFQQAIDGGAQVIFPLRDQFYGYRSGRVQDPFGHQWIISRWIEDVSPEEMQRRMDHLTE